jgi:hypothetical protein
MSLNFRSATPLHSSAKLRRRYIELGNQAWNVPATQTTQECLEILPLRQHIAMRMHIRQLQPYVSRHTRVSHYAVSTTFAYNSSLLCALGCLCGILDYDHLPNGIWNDFDQDDPHEDDDSQISFHFHLAGAKLPNKDYNTPGGHANFVRV